MLLSLCGSRLCLQKFARAFYQLQFAPSSLHVNGTPHKLLLNFQLLYFSLPLMNKEDHFLGRLCLSKPTYNTVFLVGRTQ